MTPEGYVKASVRKILKAGGHYQHWPVQTGYGRRTVDCLACVYGVFVAIECKRDPGKAIRFNKHIPRANRATVNQEKILHEVRDAGGISLTICSQNGDPLPAVIKMIERKLIDGG